MTVHAATTLDVRERRQRQVRLLGLAALIACCLAALSLGPVRIDPTKTLAIVADRAGLTLPWSFATHEAMILLDIRLPRLLLAMVVGATLGAAGAVLQALFRNPLAEPGLVGVSSGAALGAVSLLVGLDLLAGAGGGPLASHLLPLAAFAGGLLATLLLYGLSRSVPGDPVPTMLLIGIAINAMAASGIGLAQYVSDDNELRQITFWMMGGFGSARWQTLWLPLVVMAATTASLIALARPLNAYLLGTREAQHLGIDVRALTRRSVLLVALGVGTAVSLSGIIGFVGLIVPHAVRLVSGPDNRAVLPGAAILGAAFMVVMDTGARTLAAPAEIPVGLACSALGGPFFLWLLLHRARRSAA